MEHEKQGMVLCGVHKVYGEHGSNTRTYTQMKNKSGTSIWKRGDDKSNQSVPDTMR